MKRKFILLSLIPISATIPMIELVGCDNQDVEPVEPSGCIDIMKQYQPDMPVPTPDPGTVFTPEEARAKYLEVNEKTNNKVFFEDALYSASLAFRAKFFKIQWPDNEISECKIRYRIGETGFGNPDDINFNVDFVMKGKHCKFRTGMNLDAYILLEDFSIVINWELRHYTMAFDWGPMDLFVGEHAGFDLRFTDKALGVSRVKIKGYGIQDGERTRFNRDLEIPPEGFRDWSNPASYVPKGFLGDESEAFTFFSYYFKGCKTAKF